MLANLTAYAHDSTLSRETTMGTEPVVCIAVDTVQNVLYMAYMTPVGPGRPKMDIGNLPKCPVEYLCNFDGSAPIQTVGLF